MKKNYYKKTIGLKIRTQPGMDANVQSYSCSTLYKKNLLRE